MRKTMSDQHEQLKQAASDAINELFSDDSVGPLEAIEALKDLTGEIKVLIASLYETMGEG